MAFFKEESEFQFQFLSRLFFFACVFRVLIIPFRVLMTEKEETSLKGVFLLLLLLGIKCFCSGIMRKCLRRIIKREVE